MNKRTISIKVVLLLTIVCLAGFFTSCAKKRTVVFDSCGGTAVETVSVKNKGTIQKPADPTREGYTFEYWTLNGEKFDFSTKITSDITLVAVWKEISVKPVKKIETPKNVRIEANVVSWDAVEDATGYIVYVDGVATEVTTTSYTLEVTDKIEVLICVAAKNEDSVSELSNSVSYRKEIDETKVQDVINKLGLPTTGYEEGAKEIAYVLEKYSITPEQLLSVIGGSEEPTTSILEVLQSENAVEMLEAIVVCGCVLGQVMADQQETMIPVVSEQTQTLLETLYRDLISKDLYKPDKSYEKYSDDKVFAEQLAPYVLYAAAYSTSSLDLVISKLTEYAKFSIYRADKDLVLEISKDNKFIISIQQIGKYNDYFRSLDTPEATIQRTTYRQALNELNDCTMPLTIDYKALSNSLKSQLSNVRACISVNGADVVNAIKQVLTIQVALAPVIEGFGNLQSEMEKAMSDLALLPAFLEKVVNLKNQAVDIVSSILPTEKQCAALDSILEELANLLAPVLGVEVAEDTVKYGTYAIVESLNKVLTFLKSIDTKNYNIEAIFKAYLLNSTIDMNTANAEIAKLVNNLLATLKDVVTSYKVSAKDIATLIETLTSTTSVVSRIQIMFGVKLDEEQINKISTILARFIAHIETKKLTADDISKIIEFVMSAISDGPTDKNIFKLIIDVVYPRVEDYLTVDLVDEIAPYFRAIIEYFNIVENESQVDADKIIASVKKNITALKEFLVLGLNVSCANGVEDLEETIDLWLELANDSEKLARITVALKDLIEAAGNVAAESEIYVQLTDPNLKANLTNAKNLIGKKRYELVESDEALIRKIDALVDWEYPENVLTDIATVELNPEENKITVTLNSDLEDCYISPATFTVICRIGTDGCSYAYLRNFVCSEDGKTVTITIDTNEFGHIDVMGVEGYALEIDYIVINGSSYSFESDIDLTGFKLIW